MARTVALQTVSFAGKSLDQHHKEISKTLLEAETPIRLEDAMSILQITDPFARTVIKRSMLVRLKPDGDLYPTLTVTKKWLHSTDKIPGVEKGKVTMTYPRTTVPTTELAAKVEHHNGELSESVRNAALDIASRLAERANSRLDPNSIAYIAEDIGTIISDSAAKSREIAVHESYRPLLEKQTQMMQDMLETMRNAQSTGKSVRA